MNNQADIRTGADHRRGERSALQRSSGGGQAREPYRVCFVCTGNICRSPMAEWVLRARIAEAGLSDVVEVDSAGTGDWHVGDGADPRTVRVLARHGYPSRHVARQFEQSDLLRRDLVIALDHGHLRTLRRWASALSGGWGAATGASSVSAPSVAAPSADPVKNAASAADAPRMAELRLLREFDPAAGPDRLDVPDPYYGSLAGFEECLAMVQDAMPGLLSHIGLALETRAG
ncbi:MAG TPA: low molecular weight protein-tyrosine-phosphatase [Actinocrinis sp.]|nr:low molecular weight protein-tyrosine-phosphatase [Actinocrinis sp.]HZP49728.1 low molecular weight protein-tyrosine-phosphatase [Actinocrinis sp.]